MTAVSLDLAAILFFLGLTGLGPRLIRWLPPALKAGILLGAAMAALERVFVEDYARNFALPPTGAPMATILAIAVSLALAFSSPIARWKMERPWLRRLCSFGLLPGFLVAAIAGPLFREFCFDVKWTSPQAPWGVLIPSFGKVFQNASPLWIGWPGARAFLDALPLALVGYVALFGDWVTGMSVIQAATPSRPDEAISLDGRRSHLSVAIRNAVMALTSPFFPSQGALWTGVHVVVVERWKQGRRAMDSLFGGVVSYYLFVPLFYMALPIITGLKPLMGVALALTLALTGFAVAQVAMAIPRSAAERGVAALTAACLVFFPAWVGLLVGAAATAALTGIGSNPEDH